MSVVTAACVVINDLHIAIAIRVECVAQAFIFTAIKIHIHRFKRLARGIINIKLRIAVNSDISYTDRIASLSILSASYFKHHPILIISTVKIMGLRHSENELRLVAIVIILIDICKNHKMIQCILLMLVIFYFHIVGSCFTCGTAPVKNYVSAYPFFTGVNLCLTIGLVKCNLSITITKS